MNFFLVAGLWDNALHRHVMFTLPTDVGVILTWFMLRWRSVLHFLFAQKMKQKMLSRAPTVLLIITPFADAYKWHFTSKNTISLTLILSQTAAFIAYGNISNAVLSLVTLHVYFSIFVCTARSQTNFHLICYSHIARSNITEHNFVAFIPYFSFHIPNFAFAGVGS